MGSIFSDFFHCSKYPMKFFLFDRELNCVYKLYIYTIFCVIYSSDIHCKLQKFMFRNV